MIKKFTSRFSIFHLMIIALLAALGIAVKSVINPLVHLLTGPLYIPGGVVAGGIYMLFLVLAVSLTGKRGSAVFCGFCQGLMVLIIGTAGSHGALSIISYTITGLSVDILMLAMRHKGCCLMCCFFGGMAANLTGTLVVNAAFFELPAIPLALSLAAAALSGGGGGALSWALTKQLRKLRVIT
jgi:hypothetical protein